MEPHYVNVKEFEAKYRSKREVYTFLTVDGDAYLPPFQDVTAYFLKDIVSGKKKCKCHAAANLAVVKNERVRNLHVPMYEGLEHKTICAFID